MIRFPSRAASLSHVEPGLAGWVGRRKAGLGYAVRILVVGMLLAAMLAKTTPLAAILVGLGTVIALFLTLGALWAFHRVQVQLRTPTLARAVPAARVPKVRIYDTVAEGEAAGWRFFGRCGTYAGQPIPFYAELDGAWFRYQGLDPDLRSQGEQERVFGALAFVGCPAPPETPTPLAAG